MIPDFITHYSRGEPFRSLSSVSKEEIDSVLKNLNPSSAWGLDRFSDPEYLPRRLMIEEKLRSEFILIGGEPELKHPIYCFLGRSESFERNSLNCAYRISIHDIPKAKLSFTYGDSMFSLDKEYRKLKGGDYLSNLCNRVFSVNDLEEIFAHEDLQRPSRLHIEAQLWIMPS